MKYILAITLCSSIAYLIGYQSGRLKYRHETIKIKNQIEKLKKFINSKELGV